MNERTASALVMASVPSVSRGKSLRPTNSNKRKPNSKSSSPPPSSQITRKRRRCLPLAKSKQPLTVAEPDVRIKNNFPGKLFLLVKSTHTQEDPILSWLVSPSQCKDNDTKKDSNATNKSNKKGLLSLVIWDKDRFLDDQSVRSSFPSQSTFRSFERQLNSWRFKRDHELEAELLKDPNLQDQNKIDIMPTKEGLRAFYHPCFQEGKPSLLQGVKRRPPGNGNKDIKESIVQSVSRSKSSPEDAKTKLPKHNTAAFKSVDRRSVPENARESTPNHRSASPCDTVDSSSSSSASKEDPEADEQNHQSSIRTDIILPSGACLRINQRIPDWAIPAQQAAIQYLYQKHSKMAKKTTSHNESYYRPSGSNSSTLQSNKAKAIEVSTKQVQEAKTSRKLASHAVETQFVFPRQPQADSFITTHDALGSLLQSHSKENNSTVDDDDGRFSDASEDEVSPPPPVDRN